MHTDHIARHNQTTKLTGRYRSIAETHRRRRRAKGTTGRYRAETMKTNLSWLFFGVFPMFVGAFALVYGLLIGMSIPEQVVTLQTHTKTVTNEVDVPSVSQACIDALNSADKGFDIATSTPPVKLIKTGKKSEKSVPVKMDVKFMNELQAKVYKIEDKYGVSKDKCLTVTPDAKTISTSVQYDTK